jgi:hypothetical protein
MKIYDFETFKKNCKSIKAIKFKKAEEIPGCYNKEHPIWGKKLKAIYVRDVAEIIGLKIYFDETIITYTTNTVDFNNVIEYIETNGLEIE